jgi:GT2 family glycosyltransferase
MTDPRVTVVVAAYGRPDALRCALESVRRQSMPDWAVLVVGDCTAPGTVDRAVASFRDERIRFVNLPERQGEQSQPNSVGVSLATSDLVAFLNHDDLWLPDHLERTCSLLQDPSIDFCATSTAFTWESSSRPDGSLVPLFADRTPERRQLPDAYWASRVLFEPVSSWVITRDLAQRVGPWRRAVDTYRLPLVDWVLRAWRAGARFRHDSTVTVLKVNHHYRGGAARLYEADPNAQRTLLRLLSTQSPDEFRQDIVAPDLLDPVGPRGRGVRDVWQAFGPSPAGLARTARLRDPESAAAFLQTGHDAWDEIAAEMGGTRGDLVTGLLTRRTGESLEPRMPFNDLVASARAQLVAR